MGMQSGLWGLSMIKIAVFASGNGTNFVALSEHIQATGLPVTITRLICDHPEAPVVQRATQLGVPVWAHRVKEFGTKANFERAVLQELQVDGDQLLVLAGYMRIVTHVLLDAYPKLIMNIHPALLPSFPGRHGIEDAFEYGVKVTGVTVHYVDDGVDSGPIIAQQAVNILPGDSVDQLAQRIHNVEHDLYFTSLQRVLQDKGWF